MSSQAFAICTGFPYTRSHMIGFLRGKIHEVAGNKIWLDIQGVGYQITVPVSQLSEAKPGMETFWYIHDHLREDAHDLYGFSAKKELDLFEQLLSISGVGPKVALAIMAIGSVETVHRAIMAGDVDRLTSVPGIGKKTAQKIVLELKGQLVEPDQGSQEDKDVVSALESLGYSANHAREALKAVGPDIVDVSARVRAALRHMAK